MPKVQVNHCYGDHPPGSIVQMSDAEMQQVLASRGGKLVEERAVEAAVETATEVRAEQAENRGGMSKSKVRPEKR